MGRWVFLKKKAGPALAIRQEHCQKREMIKKETLGMVGVKAKSNVAKNQIRIQSIHLLAAGYRYCQLPKRGAIQDNLSPMMETAG